MKLFVDIEKNFGRFCLRAKFETDGDVTGRWALPAAEKA